MAEIVDRITTNLSSPRVLVTVAGIGLVALLAGWLARKLGRLAMLGAAAVPLVIASVVLVRPYFRDREVVEALPMAPVGTPTATAPATGSPPAPAAPVVVTRSTLRGLGGHSARGAVALYRYADGSHLVRFESVEIEGTPTPRVYVVPGAGRDRPGGAALGGLKAEKGTFHYSVAAPAGPVTVLVWCERFAVPIAGATLS